MKKAKIPAIHVPVQKSDGSMEWVWYMFFQWLATIAEKTDLSNYFTKEEVNALLDEKVTITDEADKIYGTDNEGEQYFYDLSYFAADDDVVHKSGDEEISGIKTFNAAPRLGRNLTPSTAATKPSIIEDALLSTSLNTNGIIDGAGITRVQKVNGAREVRYRAGFRNTTNTGNLWPSVNVGVNPDNTTYVDLSTSNNDYNYAKTPTDNDAKDTQIATTLWAYRNRSTYTTNCITEIPQDINLTLSNGTLTLKAGSKVYVPNGAGNFDIRTIDIDKTTTEGPGTAQWLYTVSSGGNIFARLLSNCTSGPGATAVGGFAYDTTTNNIGYYNVSGVKQLSDISFPICICTSTNGVITSIDQVFNGFGYIGSTVFALPGVKGLIPNGRNTDGSLKNTSFTTSSVIARTFATTENQASSAYGIDGSSFSRLGTGSYSYNEQENRNYNASATWGHVFLGYFTLTAGFVSNFAPRSAFHAADYSDIYTKKESDDNFVHKTGDETIDGEKTFLQPIKGQSTQYNYHAIDLGHQNKDYMDFYEYGALWNFYKNRTSDNTLVAKIAENSLTLATNSTSELTIPTMGWVNNPSVSTNVAHRSGNETISGAKKFTSEIAGTMASYTASNGDSAAAPYKKIMECVLTGTHQSVIIPFLYTRTSVNLGNTAYAGKIALRTEGTAGTLSTAGSGVMLSTFPNDVQDGNYRFYILYKNNYPATNQVTCQIWVYVKQTYAGVFVTPIRLGRGGANYSNDSYFTWGNNMDQQAALPSNYSSISQTTVTTYAKASDAVNSILTTVNKSKAASGYFKLGNGLIVQWMCAKTTTQNTAISLPTAFSSATSYSVVAVRNLSTGEDAVPVVVTEQTSTSFKLARYSGMGSGAAYNIIAIGY